LRAKYIYPFAVGYQAIAKVVRDAIKQHPEDWRELIRRGFSHINWGLDNPEWEGIATSNGRPLNRRMYIDLTYLKIKEMIQLSITSEEKQRLELNQRIPTYNFGNKDYPPYIRTYLTQLERSGTLASFIRDTVRERKKITHNELSAKIENAGWRISGGLVATLKCLKDYTNQISQTDYLGERIYEWIDNNNL
jgi:hypothetical protein